MSGQVVPNRTLAWLNARPRLVRAASIAVTLIAWEWYGRSIDPIFLSYPTAIAAAVPRLVVDGQLQAAFASSLHVLLLGFGLAVLAGVVLGLLMGRYKLVDSILDVQISTLYVIPNAAIIPLVILWFGIDTTAKVTIVFLSSFFPIVMNTWGGVRNISQHLVDIARVEDATEAQIFRKIIFPAALPFIATGLRLAVGRAIVGMVVAEMFTTTAGLGGSIIVYANAFATDKLFVVILILALLGIVLTELVKRAEACLAPWKESERAN